MIRVAQRVDGPTQTKMIRAAARSSAGSSVKRSWSAVLVDELRQSGLVDRTRPAKWLIFFSSTSRTKTWWPSSAKHAAVTSPTQPAPITPTAGFEPRTTPTGAARKMLTHRRLLRRRARVVASFHTTYSTKSARPSAERTVQGLDDRLVRVAGAWPSASALIRPPAGNHGLAQSARRAAPAIHQKNRRAPPSSSCTPRLMRSRPRWRRTAG